MRVFVLLIVLIFCPIFKLEVSYSQTNKETNNSGGIFHIERGKKRQIRRQHRNKSEAQGKNFQGDCHSHLDIPSANSIESMISFLGNECSITDLSRKSNLSAEPMLDTLICNNCENSLTRNLESKENRLEREVLIEDEMGSMFLQRYQTLVMQKMQEVSNLETLISANSISEESKRKLASCQPKNLMATLLAKGNPCNVNKKGVKTQWAFLQEDLKKIYKEGPTHNWRDNFESAYYHQYASSLLELPVDKNFQNKSVSSIFQGDDKEIQSNQCLSKSEFDFLNNMKLSHERTQAMQSLAKGASKILEQFHKVTSLENLNLNNLKSVVFGEILKDREAFKAFQFAYEDPLFRSIVSNPSSFKPFLEGLAKAQRGLELEMKNKNEIGAPLTIEQQENFFNAIVNNVYGIGLNKGQIGLETEKVFEPMIDDIAKSCVSMQESLEKFACALPSHNDLKALKGEMRPTIARAMAEHGDEKKEIAQNFLLSYCENLDNREAYTGEKATQTVKAYQNILDLLDDSNQRDTYAKSSRAVTSQDDNMMTKYCSIINALKDDPLKTGKPFFKFPSNDQEIAGYKNKLLNEVCLKENLDNKALLSLCDSGNKEYFEKTWSTLAQLFQSKLNAVDKEGNRYYDSKKDLAVSEKRLQDSLLFFEAGEEASKIQQAIISNVSDSRNQKGNDYKVDDNGKVIYAPSRETLAANGYAARMRANFLKGKGLTEEQVKEAHANYAAGDRSPASSGKNSIVSEDIPAVSQSNQAVVPGPFTPDLISNASQFNGQFAKVTNDLSKNIASSNNIENSDELRGYVDSLKNKVEDAQKELERYKEELAREKDIQRKNELEKNITELEEEQKARAQEMNQIYSDVDRARKSGERASIAFGDNSESSLGSALAQGASRAAGQVASKAATSSSPSLTSAGSYGAAQGAMRASGKYAPRTFTEDKQLELRMTKNEKMKQLLRDATDSGGVSLGINEEEDRVHIILRNKAIDTQNDQLALPKDKLDALIVDMHKAGKKSIEVDFFDENAIAIYELNDEGSLEFLEYQIGGTKAANIPPLVYNVADELTQQYQDFITGKGAERSPASFPKIEKKDGNKPTPKNPKLLDELNQVIEQSKE